MQIQNNQNYFKVLLFKKLHKCKIWKFFKAKDIKYVTVEFSADFSAKNIWKIWNHL